MLQRFKEYKKDHTDLLRSLLIEMNLGLVHKVVNELAPKFPSIDKSDMESEGELALTLAVDHFDPDRGTKFSTYAITAIRYAILSLVNKWAIRRGRLTQDMIKRISGCIAKLSEKGSVPTDEMVAAAAGGGVTADDVKDFRDGPQWLVSLDEVSDPDAKYALVDSIADSSNCDPGEVVENELIRDKLYRELAKLDPQSQDVVRRYVGLPPYREKQTFQKIGDELGFSKQRANQIYSKAKKSLQQAMNDDGYDGDDELDL